MHLLFLAASAVGTIATYVCSHVHSMSASAVVQVRRYTGVLGRHGLNVAMLLSVISVGIDLKERRGSDVEMFEILPMD